MALADYDQVIGIALNNADAYINRGIAYSSLGDYEEAIALGWWCGMCSFGRSAHALGWWCGM